MTFKIDFGQTFPHLPRAPIVEAVIHWRARAEAKVNPAELEQQLTERLPDYPNQRPQREVLLEVGPDGADVQVRRDHWHGFRFESQDKLHVAQFTRNGFVFSRLAPYQQWESFEAEALRLWQIHLELTAPSEIERLGVRFINRIVPVEVNDMARYLVIPPKCPDALGALPFEGFLYQNRFDVPGHPYNLNVIQTIQPAVPPDEEGPALILDIDVFTPAPLVPDDEIVKERLREMRWIKNKTFFTFVTRETIATFEEEPND